MNRIRASWDFRECSRLGVGGACVLLASGAMGQTYVNLTTVDVYKGGVSIGVVPDGGMALINGAYYTRDAAGGGGSGTYIRLYDVKAANKGIVSGYNYDGTLAKRPPFDVDLPNGFEPHMTMGDLRYIMLGDPGSEQMYYAFSLDINQATPPYHSLEQVLIYTNPTIVDPPPTTEQQPAGTQGSSGMLGTLRYGMDYTGQDNAVLLDYSIKAGSGQPDMFLYVPATYFAGASLTDTVYLFSRFGGFLSAAPGTTTPDTFYWYNNDGFEEWSLPPGYATVPEPEEYAALAAVLCGAYAFRRRIAGSKP